MKDNVDIQHIRERIDELNRQAWDTRVNDSPKSFELSRASVEQARSINYQKGLAHGLKSLAFCFVRVAKNEEAIPLLNEALSLLESLNDLEGQAVVNGYLAIVQRNRGDLGASLELSFKALELSHRTGFRENEATDLYQIGVTYKQLGDFEKALDYLYKSLSMFRDDQSRLLQSYPINVIGSIYFENGDYARALDFFEEGLALRRAYLDKLGEAGSLDNIGFAHFKLGNYLTAITYCRESLAVAENTGDKRTQSNALLHLAEIYKHEGDIEEAVRLSNESLEIRKSIGDRRREVEMLLFLAELHQTLSANDYACQLLNDAWRIAEELKMLDLLSRTRLYLSAIYRRLGNYEKAFMHLDVHLTLEKEFHKNTISQKVSNLEISRKAEEAKKEADAERLKNEELTKLNEEIKAQKQMLVDALANLQATQAQLVQREKMASLGELTAGIAHEIQNPLNFINNFSSINTELLEELTQANKQGNPVEVESIATALRENEAKITYHGKRADIIVKSMLQHSRGASGERMLTNINQLVEEHLRLAYHGHRAKDHSFNVNIVTAYDPHVEQLNVVPQDIGRVLLNLFNNAFYAVSEKKLQLNGTYEPVVSVSTKRKGNTLIITVNDNGTGMPQMVTEKVFQPFFTTKPSGEGTGLGLSLSYDIITKGHGGHLTVSSREGEGSEFVIELPLNKEKEENISL